MGELCGQLPCIRVGIWMWSITKKHQNHAGKTSKEAAGKQDHASTRNAQKAKTE